MAGYIENLRAFDSHERGILLQWSAGRDFGLSAEIRSQIQSKICHEVPRSAFVALDYTLDWLYAAVFCTTEGGVEAVAAATQKWPQPGVLAANPEDVDLLIAWEDEASHPHTVLIEAKGFTGWKHHQLKSKAERLAAIFPEEAAERFDVHFMLAGPSISKNLQTDSWPTWMKPNLRIHFLEIPSPGDRYSVQRCDEFGTPMQKGYTHWRARQRQWLP